MENWSGKIAVVTGASAGIGQAILEVLVKNGIHVVGLARRSDKIEEFAKTLVDAAGKIYAFKCDVSDPKSVKEAFKWIEEKFGSINILVNNAGVLYNGKITDEGDEVEEKLASVINTNFTGVVNCTRGGVRLMKKSNDYGMVININSIVGHTIPFGNGANIYAPTKHAITAFSESLRQELVLENNAKIRVSNISPGIVKTEIAVTSGSYENTEIYKQVPHLLPQEVAQAVTFLLQTPFNVNLSQITIKPVLEKF